MNSREQQAREALILKLIEGYPSLAGRATRGLIDAYVEATAASDVEALRAACQRFSRGDVPGFNTNYAPTAADLAAQARLIHDATHPKVVQLHNGLIEMDFGHGRIDMRGLTTEQQDRIIKDGGNINGKNAALMSLEEKRAALAGQITDKRPQMPRIKRI